MSATRSASTEENKIRSWWGERWPDANIGILLGPASGLGILDVDVRPNSDGRATLAELLAERGMALPETFLAESGGGGLHYYFKIPVGCKGGVSAVGLGLERKLGAAAYAIAPPSNHISGKPYRWLHGRGAMATWPQWLLDLPAITADGTDDTDQDDNPEIYQDGNRNTALFRWLCNLRGQHGASQNELVESGRTWNDLHCSPPLSEDEVSLSANSSYKYRVGYDFGELGASHNFADAMGTDVKFVAAQNLWYIWDESRGLFNPDQKLSIQLYVEDFLHELELKDELESNPHHKHTDAIARLKTHSKIQSIISLARAKENIALPPNALDADPWLLNCHNVAYDLRSGIPLAHSRTYLFSKSADVAYHPKATCPRWLQFLDEIMLGRQDLVDFLQRAVGYCLTGKTTENCFFLLHGGGANGKSVFLKTILRLLGGYAMNSPSSLLIAKRFEGGQTNDVARLAGVRFTTCIEVSKGRSFDEAAVKSFTGGDVVSARLLYQNTFDFSPQFKIWMAVNDLPNVRDTSEGFWRRVRLIPFDYKVPDESMDKHLDEKMFSQEGAGILAWAIAGCAAWQALDDLGAPDLVLKSTKEYRELNDQVSEFLSEKAELKPDAIAYSAELFMAYQNWCQEGGVERELRLSQTAFGLELGRRGFVKHMDSRGKRGWRGLALNTQEELQLGR